MSLSRCKGCGITIYTETLPEGISICEKCYSEVQIKSDEELRSRRDFKADPNLPRFLIDSESIVILRR